MKWMNLEPIIQSEISQKDKNSYFILSIYTFGVQKDGTDEIICRAAMEIQTQRADFWTQGEGEERESEMYGESNMET